MDGRFSTKDRRFLTMDGRFTTNDGRFATTDGRFATMENRFATMGNRSIASAGRLECSDAGRDDGGHRVGTTNVPHCPTNFAPCFAKGVSSWRSKGVGRWSAFVPITKTKSRKEKKP